jgi:acyl-CoA thioester hydrolase
MIENLTRLRVRYADTDQMGVAYYARYLEWFEVGRTEMLRALGLPYAEIEKQKVALPVLEAHCKYHRPALYDQLLRVASRLKEMPRARLRIDYEIFDEAGELLAEGYTLHTFINPEGRAVRPPRVFMQTINEFFTQP